MPWAAHAWEVRKCRQTARDICSIHSAVKRGKTTTTRSERWERRIMSVWEAWDVSAQGGEKEEEERADRMRRVQCQRALKEMGKTEG